MFKHNFHTHTKYSDGKAEPEAYIEAAIACGMHSLGFSEHAPLPFENNFSVKDAAHLQQYTKEIHELKQKYREILNIFTALEADYLPGVSLDFSQLKKDFNLDYIIGSVHLVQGSDGHMWFIDGPDREIWKNGLERIFDNDIRKAVTTYYEQIEDMIHNQKPDVIGHIDKIMMHNQNEYMNGDESWYRELVMQCLHIARAHGSIIEINTRGLYKKRYHTFFPGPWIIREMRKMDIPITISSDAHTPADVNKLLNNAADVIRLAGYKEVSILKESGWETVPLD